MASTILLLFATSCLLLSPTRGFQSAGNKPLPKSTCFSSDTTALRFVTAAKSSPDDDDDEGLPPKQTSDLSWLKNAMDSPSSPEPDGLFLVETKPGISGFAVDPDLGFVVVLVGEKLDRATYAIVSPKDKQQVRSAEALCLVQLAGGLDLGTTILPPDILAKLVAEKVGGDDDAREIRPHVKLLRVDVIHNQEEEREKQERIQRSNPVAVIETTQERNARIESQAPKVFAAVRKLPGLLECTQEDVVEAMRLHADGAGKLDRAAFDSFLDTLREKLNTTEPSKVSFILTVSLKGKEMTIPAPSTVIAVGLALRYKVDVVVSEECQVKGFDVVEIASRFPAFRPIQELYEDAKIIDGFIPSMFKQVVAPENDDKM